MSAEVVIALVVTRGVTPAGPPFTVTTTALTPSLTKSKLRDLTLQNMELLGGNAMIMFEGPVELTVIANGV